MKLGLRETQSKCNQARHRQFEELKLIIHNPGVLKSLRFLLQLSASTRYGLNFKMGLSRTPLEILLDTPCILPAASIFMDIGLDIQIFHFHILQLTAFAGCGIEDSVVRSVLAVGAHLSHLRRLKHPNS